MWYITVYWEYLLGKPKRCTSCLSALTPSNPSSTGQCGAAAGAINVSQRSSQGTDYIPGVHQGVYVLFWVAVQELSSSYYMGETTLIPI